MKLKKNSKSETNHTSRNLDFGRPYCVLDGFSRLGGSGSRRNTEQRNLKTMTTTRSSSKTHGQQKRSLRNAPRTGPKCAQNQETPMEEPSSHRQRLGPCPVIYIYIYIYIYMYIYCVSFSCIFVAFLYDCICVVILYFEYY